MLCIITQQMARYNISLNPKLKEELDKRLPVGKSFSSWVADRIIEFSASIVISENRLSGSQ